MKGRGGGGLCGRKPGLYTLLVSFIQDQILFYISEAAADLLTLYSVSGPSVLLSLRELPLNQHSSSWPKLSPFHMEKSQCSNEPQLFIYRRKSQWQNSSDCLRSTREKCPTEIWHILWDLWESRTVFPRQAAFPASSLAAWSFSETPHGNYAEEIIWSSAN